MTKLDWPDLIFDQFTPEQFADWFSPWTGLVNGRVAPAIMTKFGSWFLRRPEGHVEMLDVFEGSLTQTHSTYEEFVRDVNEQGWQEIYLQSKLVLQLHECGKVPTAKQCYALAPHPAVGGPNPMNDDAIDPRFVSVMDIPLWQSLCAQFLGVEH